ncbi:MAG: hypothetical protein KDC87_21325 [Planctomycetes bacterium]|nr:hypothetical protein [Planctomycetota bacterium]MCB9871245.1 hypothetical protein [Planctomycetota bacterium]
MKLHLATLFPAFLAAGCGPAGIVGGARELTTTQTTAQVVVVVVNDNQEPLVLSVNGQSFTVDNLKIAPGSSAELRMPPGERLRVRGQDDTPDRAPVGWDYTVEATGSRTTTRLGKETMVFSSLYAQGSTPERVDIQHYDGATQTFRQVSTTELGFAPTGVCLAPGGSRAYLLRDLGAGQVELRAYRLDAASGALSLIVPEGDTAPNPQQLDYTSRVECVADPRGRFFYVLDHNDSTSRTRVRSFAVERDGTLQLRSTFTRGLIRTLAFTADGRNAYAAETLGSGHVIRALRIRADDGAFDFQINEAATPCSALDTNPPRIFLAPSGRAAFVMVADSTPAVRLGSYELLSDGSIFQNAQCLGFQTFYDLSFDPRGDVIYVTGKNSSGQEGVLRYSIDPVNGQLVLLGTQVVPAGLGWLTSQQEPDLSSSDPAKNIVLLARDDTLVPHTRGAGAVLEPVVTGSGTPSLPYGSTATVRALRGAVRGCATTTHN